MATEKASKSQNRRSKNSQVMCMWYYRAGSPAHFFAYTLHKTSTQKIHISNGNGNETLGADFWVWH